MYKRLLTIALCMCLLVLTLTACSHAVGSNKIEAGLNKYLNAMEKYRNFQGDVLIEKDGQILVRTAYGMSDVEKNIKNKNSTKFPIGSVTKQFTAMAVMQLQEKGKLDVKDKLSKYISDYPNGDKITIYNLLTHTSGIPNFPSASDITAFKTEDIKTEDCINIFKNAPLDFEPGSRWSYSNSGYILLGYIVEKVSGISLENYLTQNIFTPLKMNNTGVCYKNGVKMFDSNGYTGYLEVQPTGDETLLKVAFGAGFMYSTIDDLSKWADALSSEKLVSKKTMDQIFKPYENTLADGFYGYGWFVPESGTGEIHHGGNTVGFTSMMSVDFDKKLNVIILSNKGYSDLTTVKNTLRNIVLGENYSVPEELKETSINSKDYGNYTGTYQSDQGWKIIISRDNKNFYAQLTGQGKVEIFPKSDTEFFYKKVDAHITFVKDSEGLIKSLVFNQNGQKITADKINAETELRKEIKGDPKIYYKYVGQYNAVAGFTMTVTTEGDKIFAQITGQQKFEIFPESESSFFYKVVDAQIEFVKDGSGGVTGAVLKQAGQEFKMKKVK